MVLILKLVFYLFFICLQLKTECKIETNLCIEEFTFFYIGIFVARDLIYFFDYIKLLPTVSVDAEKISGTHTQNMYV